MRSAESPCPFHAIYSREDAPMVHPLLDLIHRRLVMTYPRRFGFLPWPRRWRLEQDTLERSRVVLLFWSDRAAQDESVCETVNRGVISGRRFAVVCLDDSTTPGLPQGTPEYPVKVRFLAGHQWYGWLAQFSREIAGAIAASHMLKLGMKPRTLSSELLPSGHTQR